MGWITVPTLVDPSSHAMVAVNAGAGVVAGAADTFHGTGVKTSPSTR